MTRDLVFESSGMARINRTFGTIYKPRLNSPIIKYFQAGRAAQRKADKR